MALERSAPGELELVQSFVNTRDLEADTEELAAPLDLHDWLSDRDLLDPGEPVGALDLRRAVRLREALRALLLANSGVDADPSAAAELDAAARRARLSARFGPDGTAGLEPAADGVDAALGRLLAIVSRSMADGTWRRLKACRSEDCLWAFYDATKNRSGVWCAMGVCGNRAKARSYRARHRDIVS
jgi:predicted RNA-binding Zn ribbon-like protein